MTCNDVPAPSVHSLCDAPAACAIQVFSSISSNIHKWHNPAACCHQVRNRNSEEYNVLKIQLEGIIDELERHFEQVSRHQPELGQLSNALSRTCTTEGCFVAGSKLKQAAITSLPQPAGCVL